MPGRDKLVPYTRCTTFIDVIEDKSSLMKWGQRMVLVGATKAPQIVREAVGLDPTDKEGKKALDAKVDQLVSIAGANDKREKGSHLHKLSEYVDRGEPLPECSPQDRADMAAYMGKRHAPVDFIPERVLTKVLSRVEPGPGGCLLTLQGVGSHGYGQIGWTEGGREYAGLTHRVAWIGQRGPIPPGHDIHHTCFVRRCVNVEHMRVMPSFENRRRTNGQDWEIGDCKYGHPNELRREINGRMRCGPCWEIWWMGYRAGQRQKREEEWISAYGE